MYINSKEQAFAEISKIINLFMMIIQKGPTRGRFDIAERHHQFIGEVIINIRFSNYSEVIAIKHLNNSIDSIYLSFIRKQTLFYGVIYWISEYDFRSKFDKLIDVIDLYKDEFDKYSF